MKALKIAVVLAPRASALADSDSPMRDVAALTVALKLATKSQATVSAMSVAGPLQSTSVCQEALSLGCDKAICVRSPLAVDFWGTATLLARVLSDESPDVIICGDHYVDNGSADVAGALAQQLDWPLLTGVVDAKLNSKGLWVESRSEEGRQEQQCTGPMVLAALMVQDGKDAQFASQGKTKKSTKKATKPKNGAKVKELFADSLLDDMGALKDRSRLNSYVDFAASPLGVELISEPAELLARLLKEKIWKP